VRAVDRLDVGRPGFRAVRVRVTALDIENGRAGDCFGSPISSAIKRHLRRPYAAAVAGGAVFLFDGSRTPIEHSPVKLPTRAEALQVEFDRSRFVHPFAFNLPLPVDFLKRPGAARPGFARG